MRRNLILIAAVLVSILLAVNSARRILTLRTTAGKVEEAQRQLEETRRENEALARELEYKKSDQFVEEEIRNKLGLAKPGETIVVLPKNDSSQLTVNGQQSTQVPNWKKWWNLFFGG